MAVPDYESIMLPLLALAGDSQEHTYREAIDRLADEFQLSEEDRRELLGSGRQAKFDNRVGWAMTHLKKAGCLEGRKRGYFNITSRGLQVLASNPLEINDTFLRQFPEYVEFKGVSRQGSGPCEKKDEKRGETPVESLEESCQQLRRELADELLEHVKNCSPRFFENLVVDLLIAMGYGGSRHDVEQAVGRTGDDGIDGIIKEDRLGLDIVYVQAKRWQSTVGRPVVQAFAGSLEGQRARKGVLFTTSEFSQEAREYVTRIEKKVVLVAGDQLAQLMIDHDIGVAPVATYVVKIVDSDYFDEG